MSKQKEFSISEEDIQDRAKSIIELAKDNSVESVITIFELISLPFDGENYKRKVFQKVFELANIEAFWDNELGFLVPSINRTKKTVVSHMDLIKKFNNGFANGQFYKIEDDKLVGALDNTFTNAIVINSLLNKQNKDTTYLFTLDEETSQKAIKSYMKRFGSEQFIFNLDVTNDGKNSHMSIEYDEPCYHICKQINDNLINPFFTTDRVGDDLDKVLQADGKGFSYCLPTEKTIHSYKNFTYLKNIQPYMDGLSFLIHDLCLKISSKNIDYLSIEKALKHKSFEKMKEKDIYVIPKQKTRKVKSGLIKYRHREEGYSGKNFCSNCKSYFNKPLAGNGTFWCPACYEEVKIHTALDNEDSIFKKLLIDLCPDQFKEDILDFLDYYLNSEESFSESDLPSEVFYEFLNYEFIINDYINLYRFNKDILDTTPFMAYKILLDFPIEYPEEIFKLMYDGNYNKFGVEDLARFSKTNNVLVAQQAIDKMIKKKILKKSKQKYKLL